MRRSACTTSCSTSFVIDDTGFLKQGKGSPGVQRQYTGSAGKITNCQIGVSLELATATQHAPVDFELYLPQSWAQSPDKRKKAHIPDDVTFKTKPELALQMLERAARAGYPETSSSLTVRTAGWPGSATP